MSLIALKNAISSSITKEEDYELSVQSDSSNTQTLVNPKIISDLVIGLSDGLTVPFALTAGLSSLGEARLVIIGGFAELISGSISMGVGGYLAAKSEKDYYLNEYDRSKVTLPTSDEIEDILREINPNFSETTLASFAADMQQEPDMLIEFAVRYGKGLEKPSDYTEWVSALTIGGGYFTGGFMPLIPYFFVAHVGTGLLISIMLMVVTLFLFGFGKTHFSLAGCTTRKKVSEGLKMILVGGSAAFAAWFMVRITL